jgi:ribosome biogenesis GTPase
VLTGDWVNLERIGDGRALVTGVIPRRCKLDRPPIANIDVVVVVFTTKSPPLDLGLVDRLLVLVRAAGLEPLLCLNKIDLSAPEEMSSIEDYYSGSGFRLVATSAKLGTKLDTLVEAIGGRLAVLAGQSGVGKSTLLNALAPGSDLEVGELSQKVQRGRHTTRGVRLIAVGKGMIADTPGFVSLDLPDLEPLELAAAYAEMAPYTGLCRFSDCLHDPEPDCAVKAAVARCRINEGRFRGYLALLHELQARRKYQR